MAVGDLMTLDDFINRKSAMNKGFNKANRLAAKAMVYDDVIVDQWRHVKKCRKNTTLDMNYHAMTYLLEWYTWKRPDNHGMGS